MPPLESASAGVPVTVTGSLKPASTWMTSPALYAPSAFVAERPETVGAVVSILIAVLASRLPAVPGAASVSVALFAAASRIVPPASASEPVPL